MALPSWAAALLVAVVAASAGVSILLFGLAAFAIGVLLLVVAAVALVVLLLLPTIEAYKAKRSGWWIYLICAFVGPFGIAQLIAWFAFFKSHPTKLGASEIVV